VARALITTPKLLMDPSPFSSLLLSFRQNKAWGLWRLLMAWDKSQQLQQQQHLQPLQLQGEVKAGEERSGSSSHDGVAMMAAVRNLLDLTRELLQADSSSGGFGGGKEGEKDGGGMAALVRALEFSVRRVPLEGGGGEVREDGEREEDEEGDIMELGMDDSSGREGGREGGGDVPGGLGGGEGLEEAIWKAMRMTRAGKRAQTGDEAAMAAAAQGALKDLCGGRELPRLFDRLLNEGKGEGEKEEGAVLSLCRLCSHVLVHAESSLPSSITSGGRGGGQGEREGGRMSGLVSQILNLLAYHHGSGAEPFVRRLWVAYLLPKVQAAGGGRRAFAAGHDDNVLARYHPAFHLLFSVYSHQLMALDDEEFYNRQMPLALPHVLLLVEALKGLLFQMYWVDPNQLVTASSSSLLPPLEGLQLTRAATELFNQLYQRHSRRPFPADPTTVPAAAVAGAAAAAGGGGGGTERSGSTPTSAAAADGGRGNDAAARAEKNSSDPALWHWPPITQHELDQELSAGENASDHHHYHHQQQQEEEEGSSSIETLFDTSKRLYPILTRIPQVLPFAQRVQIFQKLLASDKRQAQDDAHLYGHRIRVRRAHIYEDAFVGMNHLGKGLRGRVQVTFVSDLGTEEAGIDGGGVFKEFIDALTRRAFDPQYALFRVTPDHLLYPNPLSKLVVGDEHYQHFAFLGRVLAKALYESILVEPQFALFFLQRVGGKMNETDDLFSRDPELYRHLMSLKRLARGGKGGKEGDGEGMDVRDLALNFEVVVEDEERLLPTDEAAVELVPGGKHVAVTNENVFRYIQLVANYKLNIEINAQVQAFLRGFRDLIPMPWLRMFGAEELQILLTGEKRAIDIENLRAHTRYSGGYHPTQPIIQWFWEALRSYTPDEQSAFLMFVTSCSRQPLLGFQCLNPPMCIQRVPLTAEGGDRLPSSATCMNLLKLPAYSTPEMLREKLLYAISAGAGFELS